MQKIKDFLSRIFKENDRSAKALRNVIVMAVLKGLSILISFVLVPLTINYVDADTYGVWLTLSSIVAWISFFDIGLNNGLKNNLAISFANNDTELSKIYVSTTYAILALIFIPIMLLLSCLVPLFDWNNLLNIHNVESQKLSVALLIIVIYFCNNFILSTINIVILADQRPADAAYRTLMQQVVSLAVIYALTKTTEGDLVKLCLGLCFSPLLVNLFFNFSLFRTRYKDIKPSFSHIKFSKLPVLVKLGVSFFIIQIAGIIQFQMVNFLIIRNFGPEEVTEYNIAYKLFNGLFMCWGIVIAPLWVAITDAKAKGDWEWIANAQHKYFRIFLLFLLIGVLIFSFSGLIYQIWVGENVSVGFEMSLCVFIYTMILIFGSLYVQILNGLGELRIQVLACVISPFVFLGVSFFCLEIGVGAHSIVIGSIIANFNGYLLAPIQCKRVISNHVFISKA